MAPLASSSRSALLRAAADFVALRGFDDLYDLEKLSAQNGALASVAFQKRMPKHAAFAGNDVSACVESNFGLFTPSTRRCPCEYVCSMAWRLAKVHAI